MADVTFRRGVEANLPTSGMATEGCVYQSTDTGNMYVGSSQGTLIPVNRSPYYGTCATQASTNAKVVTLDVDEDNFTMKAGVMISVLFSNANMAASPTLNVNNKGAVAVKVYGTTNVSASPRAWEAGEVVTFVHNGSYWMMVGHKVQSDWNQTEATAEDFIKNKPTIPTINDSLSSNYGVCSSSASTVAKTVTVNNREFELSEGVRVKVKFNSANYADAPTLSVNGTAAKPIVTKGSQGVGKGESCSWGTGSVVELTYDGTSWVIDGWLNDNDVYYAGGSNVVIEDLDPFGEYEPLESIYNEASTVFSVDGVPSNQNDVFIDIRYKERSSLTHFYLFGQTGGSSPILKYGLVQSATQYTNKFHLCFRESSGAYLESTVERAENHIYRIKARLHNGTATLYVLDETTGVSNMVTTTYDITDTSSIGVIRLFAGGSSSYYCGSGTNVYFLKMNSEGKPFINYIPMRRKSDGMVGFLDTVSGSFLSSDSGNVDENKLNAGALIDRPDNHIIKVSSSVDDSNFVHKTGTETVGGEKTFTDNLKISAGKVIDLGVGNDEGVYIQASSDSNGKQIAFGDDDDDSDVRLVNVADPINSLDAANKAYVDAAVTGGSSGITLPLAVADGGTGGSTAKGAEYRLTPNLATNSTAEITDTSRIPFVRSSPSATNGSFSGYKTALLFWNYIYDKISSLFGISYDSNDEGVPLAPTAASGTNTTQIATTAFVNNATSGLAVDANVVHKTGNESIGGTKTFNNNVVLGTNANLVLGTGQDEGVYIEANSSSGGQQALTFSSLDDDSAVKLENVALPTANTDAANKQYVDDAIGNTYVSLKGTTNPTPQETYSIYPYSLCAFSTYIYPQAYMIMTSLVLSGGLSNKTPYTAHWFPIGCKIYYYNGDTALNGAFSSQRFYTTYNGVDARRSAVTGDNIDLFSDVSGGSVYLRVEIRGNNFEWRPYYKQGETNEIIVSGAQLVDGGFYIYLGRSVVSSDYMFQLEDNNPLYACVMDGSGTHLVDWATYNSSRTPYLVKNIQLFPSSQFPIGNNPIIGNTGIYSRKSYLDSGYLEGVYKVTLQLHAWWDYPTGTLDTPQPLSVIIKHNTNDKIAGGTFVIPVMDSPNDANYKMGTVVVNLTGFVTFTSAQTLQDYIEVKVQGAKGINLGGEHPLWGENEGDVEYNDGLILERIDWYNPT